METTQEHPGATQTVDPEDQQQKIEDFARLDALGQALAKTRHEAIEARAASGIEDIWREDEEHYEGIDDENRGLRPNWQTKPPGQAWPQSDTSSRSVEFVNITRPYVDAAAAKVGDVLLPTDDRSWSIQETPIPDLVEKAKGNLPPEAIEGMKGAGIGQEQIQQVQQAEALQAQKLLDEAHTKAQKAQDRIEDWNIEGQWHAEMRKVIEDCTRIGSGVLKGPVPALKKSMAYVDGTVIIKEEIKPISKRISPWNLYPDGACGESIHNGNYVWERDYITPKMLRDMMGEPEYIEAQIQACLDEGPKHTGTTMRKTSDGKILDDKDLFEIWYYHGVATREDLEAAGCTCPENASQLSIPAVLTMVNDRVIKAALNPLDTGEFPYDLMPWQRKANMPWGAGVSRQIRTAQRIVVAGVRAMLTNAGRAAGPIFIIKNGVISAADGEMEITPWKIFYAGEDDTTDDVAKAMAMLQIPSLERDLMEIVQFGLKVAEDVTGLPLLLQGQAGSAPETLGGQQLVDRNATGTLRRIARTFDDCITEPHIRRYYAWLLQYGEDDEKGDFIIDARGSTALVEREIYKNEVAQLLQASLNPAFGLDPKKTMAEHLRTTKKRPEDFQYSEEDLKKMQAQQAQQLPDPKIAVAQASVKVAEIRAASAGQEAQARTQAEMAQSNLVHRSDMAELELKQQTDQARLAAEAQEASEKRAHDLQIEQLKYNQKLIEFAHERGMHLNDVKAQLASKVMDIKAKAKQQQRPPMPPKRPNGNGMQP